MRSEDLPAIHHLARALFPDHPEDVARFAERLALGGDLCLTLAGAEGDISGYAIAYPWPLGRIPSLNRPLDGLRGAGDAIYLHDLGVHPDRSGAGHARAGLALLVGRSRMMGMGAIALVAVNASADFWRARGFTNADVDPALAEKLASYGADARYMVMPV
ncbi:GNAT family N-acetyltransferase [Methylobacterium sp. J-078]|uniref:GNAT family N-acetyltransferase n=1 Tax=Methylobacterium sp. J-078 TaxID=2836657 RepID=UPI001FB8B9E3|nr:GNAT family N-acetyltransferase [Methylobacterium sp. J-078]